MIVTILGLVACLPSVLGKLHKSPPQSGTEADYVIVGGGTSGLVLANRLSEDCNVTVIVLEAGSSQFDNPNVTSVDGYGAGLLTSIDWQYGSTPQHFTSNRTFVYNAGKGIGGTSLINGKTYVRSVVDQVNSWEKVYGNKGWNWANLFPYYLKSEQFQIPDQSQALKGASYDPKAHGLKGPLDVGWIEGIGDQNAWTRTRDAWNSVGIPTNKDPNNGNATGFSNWPLTVNRQLNIRWDAGRAYYYPVEDRSNLDLFENTEVDSIVWADTSSNPGYGDKSLVRAVAVKAHDSDGKAVIVRAKREVIISAGSLRSPGLLEASGIGNPTVLSTAKIPVKVALPSVGENLQDQPNNSLLSQAGPGQNYTGYPTYVVYATVRDLFGPDVSDIEKQVRNKIPEYAATIAASAGPGSTNASIQARLLNAQADLLFKDSVPCAEILTATFGTAVVVPLWVMLPFARGNVHINGTLQERPLINPNFFGTEWDTKVQAAAARLGRKFFEAGRTQGSFGDETTPGFAVVPANATDAEWATFLKGSYTPNYHPVGSAAMMRRELGGVVDETLKVYGTANVRVIDASVLPAQIVGHLTSTLYAVAERASDLIKQDHAR